MIAHFGSTDRDTVPSAWYNLAADLPEEVPPLLDPITRQPMDIYALEPLFARALLEQETTRRRWVEIPEEIREKLALWRPTPLVRATGLERALKTPARIYYKDESKSPPGSHKANTAVAQAHYYRQEGAGRLTTETGAGQWGCSLSLACSLFGLKCTVYMVRLSYERRPYRRSMMRLWNGAVIPSPSPQTDAGRRVLADDPQCPGSIGVAISEAVETALRDDGTKYALGSVLNHVMLHQTVIGLEVERQLKALGDDADVLIACVGGGSNFAGLTFPFLRHRLRGREIRLVAAESRACPTLTRGRYRYDYTDTTGLTPLVKMLTLGHGFVPPGIQAGGLRYHGMAPMVSLAAGLGLVETAAYHQHECFEAAKLFAGAEGIIPALESSYAIRAAIDEAARCRATGRSKAIVFVLSGHGLCDLGSYDAFLDGQVADLDCTQTSIDAALADLPPVAELPSEPVGAGKSAR